MVQKLFYVEYVSCLELVLLLLLLDGASGGIGRCRGSLGLLLGGLLGLLLGDGGLNLAVVALLSVLVNGKVVAEKTENALGEGGGVVNLKEMGNRK